MAREKISTCLNMDEPENKRRLMSKVGLLRGWWEVEISPRRNTRSLQQNKWYWSQIVAPLAEYLSDQDYNVTTSEEAHELLKARFLATTVFCKRTGDVLCRRVRSTTELTTEEFADYCERCRAWLSDFFNLQIQDPDPAWRETDVRAGAA